MRRKEKHELIARYINLGMNDEDIRKNVYCTQHEIQSVRDMLNDKGPTW